MIKRIRITPITIANANKVSGRMVNFYNQIFGQPPKKPSAKQSGQIISNKIHQKSNTKQLDTTYKNNFLMYA